MDESETKQHCPLTPMQLAGAHRLLKNPSDELAGEMFAGALVSSARYPAAPTSREGQKIPDAIREMEFNEVMRRVELMKPDDFGFSKIPPIQRYCLPSPAPENTPKE